MFKSAKTIPDGTSFSGDIIKINENKIKFIYDLSYIDKYNKQKYQQNIFDTVFSMIDNAKNYILIDWFLINDFGAKNCKIYRDLSNELTEKIINKKIENPNINIDFITDEINTAYSPGRSKQVKKLKNYGVNVIYTNLKKLRNSNKLYSFFWELFLSKFKIPSYGLLPHPFSKIEKGVSLRSYLKMFNFKANHRKIIVTDDSNNNFQTLITSANPHNTSSAHSNVAISIISNNLARDVYLSEQSVAKFSGGELSKIKFKSENITNNKSEHENTLTQLLTEKQIKLKILKELKKTKSDDYVYIGMFYLSDRDIIKTLKSIAKNSIKIHIVLDPNKDAFGYKKNGIPNKQVAYELSKIENITIKWYLTHGEQYHSKILFIKKKESSITILGSANYTRKNLENYNLESDIFIESPIDSNTTKKVSAYFTKIWNNIDGTYTIDYSYLKDESKIKVIIYKLQELSGLCTF